jgi:hypothetical protein
VLELAAEAAHVSGARQYGRLAACLAGRAAAGQTREGRIRVLEGAVKTASAAGGGQVAIWFWSVIPSRPIRGGPR